jgi:hypothetical protein
MSEPSHQMARSGEGEVLKIIKPGMDSAQVIARFAIP